MKHVYMSLLGLLSALSFGNAHSQTFSKTETIEYHDDTAKWVLGQIKRITVDGTETSRIEYHDTTQPWKTYAFGKLQQTLNYDTTSAVASGQLGTLKTDTDGNGRVTTLSNWKRGIPQTTAFADNTMKSAVVDDNGWIRSVTAENGSVTSYGYDPMGRITSIVYPTGDSTGWNTTTMVFEQIGGDELGIAAGHWRQQVTTGNGRKTVFFDALWRPLVEDTHDLGDVDNTRSLTYKRYDSSGRLAFQSYPVRVASHYMAVTQGARTSYDALDRVTRVEQDSELGVLATTTEYLAGHQTRVTNPRGFQTTTAYRAYDQPGYDQPIWVVHPEGAVTEISRDSFGKPLRLRRRNTDSSLVVDRSYVYDGFQQLCKQIEPESGTTVMDYDPAGNLEWSAAGLSLTNTDPNSCPGDRSNAYASGRRISRAYDSRNRLTSMQMPDGNGSQSWAYTAVGQPSQVTTWNDGGANLVINHYTYNRRGLLTNERKEQSWFNWSINYTYDANGFVSSQSYPDGWNTFDFVRNALGQLTRVHGFATNIRRHPNGAISEFTYGNGIVHTMTQNARLLPSRSTDSGASTPVHSGYSYDANGNVAQITDDAQGGYYNRQMTYDGLDRLTAAGSGMFGGDGWHRFTYDAVDNIKSWKLPGVKDYADYYYTPGTQRLTNIRDSTGAALVGLDYDDQGNLSNKNGQAYNFDFGNRLRNVAGKESYRYDAAGRRIFAQSASGTIGSMYNRAGELTYEWNSREGKQVAHLYLDGSPLVKLERIWATGALLIKYQHTDALGSPVAVTNEAGTIIERTNYDPYGGVLGKPVAQGVGYTGHVMDAQTGLTYMQQRYYDPTIGRFLSIDPVTPNPNTGVNFNRYWYANNNPYVYTDPDGREGRREAQRNNFCGVSGCNEGSFSRSQSPSMYIVGNATSYVANFYNIGENQVSFTTDEYNDCAQQGLCSVLFNAKSETAYLAYPQMGVGPAAGFKSASGAVKQLFGKGYPTKANRGGKQQPFNPKDGTFMPYAANPGLNLSPVSRFSSAFIQGVNEAKGSGVPGVPIGRAGSWGYWLGLAVGQLSP